MDEAEVKDRLQRAVKLISASWFPPSNPGMLERQQLSRKERPLREPLWVYKTPFPLREDSDVREAILGAIHDLGGGTGNFVLKQDDCVHVEWLGHRPSHSQPVSHGLALTEANFDALLRDTSNETTILYLQGGGFVYMNSPLLYFAFLTNHGPRQGAPWTNRTIPSALARRTGSKICQVDYRLAPQDPFPAALFDTFVAYLSLLVPPSGSLHAPIRASRIVLAGESSGGNLCLALVQLLLHLTRDGARTLNFNGAAVPLRLPAGVSLLSGYCDQTECMPSRTNMRHIDYACRQPPHTMPNFPSDSIWPTHPPRFSAYCETTALAHPLISPMSAKDWTGCPPMWFACGQEHVVDSNRLIARRASKQGVKVVWEEYEGMPHVFPQLPRMEATPQAVRCLTGWSNFITQCAESRIPFKASQGFYIGLAGNETGQIIVEDMLSEVSDEKVDQLLHESMDTLQKEYQGKRRGTSML